MIMTCCGETVTENGCDVAITRECNVLCKCDVVLSRVLQIVTHL